MNPHLPGPAASFFSATGSPIEPFSFSLGPDHGHAHDGGAG
jgi:hypothetical protein